MPEKSIPPDFENVLSDLLRWFDDTGTQAMIIGGVAVSLLAKPRLTQDIDSLISKDIGQLENFCAKGQCFGFVPRLPDAPDFARKNRVLLMRHAASRIDVDISLAGLPFEFESFKRMKRIKLAAVSIPVPTPEDLIIMKAVAHRPRDMIDIASILDATKKIDSRRIRKWVREFSAILEKPQIYDDLLRMLKEQRDG